MRRGPLDTIRPREEGLLEPWYRVAKAVALPPLKLWFNWRLEGWLAQIGWIRALGHEGGVFVTIGRRV